MVGQTNAEQHQQLGSSGEALVTLSPSNISETGINDLVCLGVWGAGDLRSVERPGREDDLPGGEDGEGAAAPPVLDPPGRQAHRVYQHPQHLRATDHLLLLVCCLWSSMSTNLTYCLLLLLILRAATRYS